MHSILIVDDEPEICRALKRVFRGSFKVMTAPNGADAIAQMSTYQPDVVITDFRMPDMNGAELLSRVRRECPDTVRLMLSGYAEMDTVSSAVSDGDVHEFVHKPWDNAQLVETLRRMLEGA